MLPAIANYFGITIDELFGYEQERSEKIRAILDRVESFSMKTRGDDGWVDECLAILRQGLAEFPRNEQLLLALADTLSEAGWRRHKEWLYYDSEGYIQHSYDRHKQNEYWAEAVKIGEFLIGHTTDSTVMTKANALLVLLYRNFGETEQAVACAMRMPPLKNCREILLAAAADGKAEAGYIGEFLLHAAREFSEQLVYGLITNRRHYDSDMPIEKVQGAIALFELLCDDGNLGIYHEDVIQLQLYLSRLQWERGYHDEAFVSLDRALDHARAREHLIPYSTHALTAPLVSFVRCPVGEPREFVRNLPDDWPVWCNPDCSSVEKEIKADPRWQKWVEKTQQ